jgi:hypothetical protein
LMIQDLFSGTTRLGLSPCKAPSQRLSLPDGDSTICVLSSPRPVMSGDRIGKFCLYKQ